MAEFQGRRATTRRMLEGQPLRVVDSPPLEELAAEARLRTRSEPDGSPARLMAIEARMTALEIALAALDHDLQELVQLTVEGFDQLRDELAEGEAATPEPDDLAMGVSTAGIWAHQHRDRFERHELDVNADQPEESADAIEDWARREAQRLRQEAQGAGAPEVDLDVDVPEEGVQVTPPGREPFDALGLNDPNVDVRHAL